MSPNNFSKSFKGHEKIEQAYLISVKTKWTSSLEMQQNLRKMIFFQFAPNGFRWTGGWTHNNVCHRGMTFLIIVKHVKLVSLV